MPSGREGQRPIDERIHCVLAGTADPGDVEAVRRWRAASPENDQSFQTSARAFDMERARMRSTDVGPLPGVRNVVWLAEAREAARKLTDSSSRGAGHAWWRAGWAVAAALVVATGGALLHRAATPRNARLQIDTFLTGDKDPVTMRLTDGSVVRLAPGSQIRLLPGSSQRMVELDGRAYFAIAHDPESPFIVRSRADDARVLGTRFHAQAAGDSLQVIVIEGEVALAGTSQEARVEAFQLGTIRRGRVETVGPIPDIGPMLDWVGNFIVFQATPLEAALTEIAEKYDMGYEIVDVICAVLGAQCSIEAGLIRIGE